MNEAAEQKMLELACNALTIAGQEMGDGDHWPVIKATVSSLRKDFEDLQTERDVFEAARCDYEKMIARIETLGKSAPAHLKPKFAHAITQLREVYVATFTPVERKDLYIDPDKLPAHIKRGAVIIDTLEADDV